MMGVASASVGWRSCIVGLIALSTAGMLSGCGGGQLVRQKPVPVKGVITFRGKPLANARVSFFGPGATLPATGETNDAGEFELTMYEKGDGALVGENKVTVVSLSGDSGMIAMDPSKVAAGGTSVPVTAEIQTVGESGVSLPKVYGDSSNTPLTFTVKPEGESSAKIELK